MEPASPDDAPTLNSDQQGSDQDPSDPQPLREAAWQPHPRPATHPAARVGLLHVLITPAPDRRALLTSLTALSAVRDPRLAVTAVLPEGDHPEELAAHGTWPGRAPRLLAPGELHAPLEGLAPEEGDALFLLRAGAVPPRGWTETLLAHGRPGGRSGQVDQGGTVAAVAAPAWTASEPDRSPTKDLERWSRSDRGARRSWYRLAEDRPRVEAPLLALFEPADLADELEAWWRGECRGSLDLTRRGAGDRRLLVAKDVLVLDHPDDRIPGLRAHLDRDERGGELEELTDPAEVRRRWLELEARLDEGVDVPASLELADLALRRGRREETIHHARTVLRSWPACAEAQLLLARALGGAGQLDAARRLLEQLFDAGPLEPRLRAGAFAALASYWLQRGEPGQARPCLDTALAADPTQPQALYTRARLLLAEGSFDLALADLEAAIRQRPLVPDMWYELGRTRLLAGREVAGRRAIERALSLDPTHEPALDLMERLEPGPKPS